MSDPALRKAYLIQMSGRIAEGLRPENQQAVMKKLLILVMAIAAISTAKAQQYDWAIGVRGGYDATSLSVKHVFGNSNAIEALVGWGYSKHGSGFNLTGLYEFNVPVIAPGFNFYYGAGAHLGSWAYKAGHDDGKNDGFNIGLDAIVGLEYKIPNAPIAFSLDWKPRLDLAPSTEFLALGFALGVKYAF